MSQTQKTKQAPAKQDEVLHTDVPQGAEVEADITDILDEIDGVLEVNAEEFVNGYIQKGGE